ncbi:hypothetical protein [Cryobacterium aureum]|uniref:hypothetical protein n=1 Tax=Cryobacterium aureum TaxID=995037 RepID=UPI000CF562E5|nr:hypothetical protein [Cryobacterium aureum]
MYELETTHPVLSGLALSAIDPTTGTEWLMEEFEGWEGSPASTIRVEQKVRGQGGSAGLAYEESRDIGIGGKVFTSSWAELKRAELQLSAACTLEDSLLTIEENGQFRHCMVRRAGKVIFERISTTVAQWSIQVVALDPRKLHAPLTGSTSLPSTTGGLTIPFTVPVVISAVQATGQITLTNPGNTAGPVFGRIDGPCVGPIVTHAGPGGGQLVFAPSLVLAAGEWLDIDYERHEVLANGQASRNKYIRARGWSSFEPGVNTWAFTAASFNAASQLTITATPADS